VTVLPAKPRQQSQKTPAAEPHYLAVRQQDAGRSVLRLLASESRELAG
jgi:hypothetical protein